MLPDTIIRRTYLEEYKRRKSEITKIKEQKKFETDAWNRLGAMGG